MNYIDLTRSKIQWGQTFIKTTISRLRKSGFSPWTRFPRKRYFSWTRFPVDEISSGRDFPWTRYPLVNGESYWASISSPIILLYRDYQVSTLTSLYTNNSYTIGSAPRISSIIEWIYSFFFFKITYFSAKIEFSLTPIVNKIGWTAIGFVCNSTGNVLKYFGLTGISTVKFNLWT